MSQFFISLILLLASGYAAATAPLLSGNAIGSVQIGMPASALATVAHVMSDQMEPDSEGSEARVIRLLVENIGVAAEVHHDKVWRI